MGVREGCVMSPWLFSVIMSGALGEMRATDPEYPAEPQWYSTVVTTLVVRK